MACFRRFSLNILGTDCRVAQSTFRSGKGDRDLKPVWSQHETCRLDWSQSTAKPPNERSYLL